MTILELPEGLKGAVTRAGHKGLPFWDFYHKVKDRPSISSLPDFILGIDPGETTGFCLLELHRTFPTFYRWQGNTSTIEWGCDVYRDLIPPHPRDFSIQVVYESYRIYAWRTKQHTWASLLTPRLIGGLEFLCRLRNVPHQAQSAQQGKAFMKGDDRLKEWELHNPGQPHSNDATKHVCNLLLFGNWN